MDFIHSCAIVASVHAGVDWIICILDKNTFFHHSSVGHCGQTIVFIVGFISSEKTENQVQIDFVACLWRERGG